MKKLLIAPMLLVIAIAVSAATIEVPEAPAFMLIAGGGVEEGCSCPVDGSPDVSSGTTGAGAILIGYDASNYYGGQRAFTVPAEKQICKVGFRIFGQTGDVDGKTYTARVWTQTGNNLNEDKGASDGLAGDSGWDYGDWIYISWSTPVALSASTDYSITLDTGETDSENYISIFYASEEDVNGAWEKWTDAGSYAQGEAADDCEIKIYYCE